MLRPAATSLSLAEAAITTRGASINTIIAKHHLRARAEGSVNNEGCTEFSAVSVAKDGDEICVLNAANR